MDEKEYEKFLKDSLERSAQYTEDAKASLGFALKQVAFWEEVAKDAQKHVENMQKYNSDAIARLKKFEAKNATTTS